MLKLRILFCNIFVSTLLFVSCQTQQESGTNPPTYTNELIHTSSPYLLQHAHNPVDWYPWGEKALERARTEDKMLLISIGYSACHWCHVMEHESFEDTTVARIMNEHFINIKIDREERPDIDAIYMTACQLASQQGCGWPLNTFALPDGRPVWAGTYFPRKQWIEILQYFIDLRRQSPEKLEDFAQRLTQGIRLQEQVNPITATNEFSPSAVAPLIARFLKQLDPRRGGRRGAPKFPMPNNYSWLLHYYRLSGDHDARQAALLTLDHLADGGIYDQIGGGFARYATDADWHVPHFEKMLYDNAQLASLYAHAYQLTGDQKYRRVMEETLAFIARELTDEAGRFYASLDADSEGEEGKFYVWTAEEIDATLAPDEAQLIKAYYDVRPRGNWEEGKNILRIQQPLTQVAAALSLDSLSARRLLGTARAKLLQKRAERIRPGLDDKVLTSWNALTLRAYTDAYRATGKENYREAAVQNGRFLLTQMMAEDGRLQRNYKDGKTDVNAFLDDYAHSLAAFIALYEITFDESWLQHARRLADYTIEHFRDTASGYFYYTSDIDPPLLVRRIEREDNVIPSSNSALARGLFHLGQYYYEAPYADIAKSMLAGVSQLMADSDYPSFYSNWGQLYLEIAHPTYEVAIVGDQFDRLRREMQVEYLPQTIFLGGAREGELPLLRNKLVADQTTIYVCLNRVCKLPVTTSAAARKLLP